LTDDPWKNQVKEFAAGQKVSGRVVRWNSNGIFIAVNENVNGLFPLEDYGVSSHSELRVREGETRTGEILKVDYDSHRLILKEDGVTAPVETAEEAE
jgi:ribosomal protein S1